MSASLRVDASNLQTGLTQFNERALAAIGMYAETEAKVLEGYTKENRPWTDRTGDARKRLTGYVTNIPNGYRINIAHGVDYGIWLELAMEKRFAILEPTIRLKSNEVLTGFSNLLERMGGV